MRPHRRLTLVNAHARFHLNETTGRAVRAAFDEIGHCDNPAMLMAYNISRLLAAAAKIPNDV